MIYLDHNATTPLDARVREAMLPFLGGPQNPSSQHRPGRAARSRRRGPKSPRWWAPIPAR